VSADALYSSLHFELLYKRITSDRHLVSIFRWEYGDTNTDPLYGMPKTIRRTDRDVQRARTPS